MNGRLDEHPLAELIYEMSAAGLTGALRLERARVKAVVYFEAGQIVFIASNLRIHKLSECAQRWGMVTEVQLLAAMSGNASDTKLASALVEMEALTPDQLDDLLARQASDILRAALLWTDGAWNFDPRVRPAEDARVKIDTKDFLPESVRRLPPEFIARSFTNRDEKLSPESGRAVNLNLLPTEAFVLSRVDAPMSVDEIISIGGLPEEETLRAIYALTLGGFLRRENGARAFSPEAIEKAKYVASKMTQSKIAAPSPADATVSSETVKQTVESPATSPSPVPEQEEFDERKELDALFARLEGNADYYQILDIGRDAESSEIKTAYYALAKRFHPDRFHHDADTSLQARVENAFAQFKRAYDALKNRESRAVYDRKLDAQERAAARAPGNLHRQQEGQTSPPATHQSSSKAAASAFQQAEDHFQKGLAAQRSSDISAAIKCFSEAARLVPNQPRYRAYYGQALAANAQTRRQAESEIQAAIKIDPNNASYRAMLAELYYSVGLQKRAQGELERALTIDSQNEVARKLLNKLRTTQMK